MASLADQDEKQLGGKWSVLVRQKRDHILLDDLLTRLPLTAGMVQDEVLHQIYRLVFPHAFAEESVLWPILRRTLPDGEELTVQVEQEHQEVNELVTRLDADTLGAGDREGVVARLVQVLREDVRDEEDVLLPRLQEQLNLAQLRRIGIAWEIVRRIAPTRPHPTVARRPPGNVVAALPLTALDRARDLLENASRRAPARGTRILQRASTALARMSGRIERMPLMRRGESPTTRTRE